MKPKLKIMMLIGILFILNVAIFVKSQEKCLTVVEKANEYLKIAKDPEGNLNAKKANAILTSKLPTEAEKSEFIKLLKKEGFTVEYSGASSYEIIPQIIPNIEKITSQKLPAKTSQEIENAKAELFNTFFENPPTSETQSEFMQNTMNRLQEEGFTIQEIGAIFRESNEQASNLKWFRENMNNPRTINTFEADPILGRRFIDAGDWERAVREGRNPSGKVDLKLKENPQFAYGESEYTLFKKAYIELMQSDKTLPGMVDEGCTIFRCRTRNSAGAMGAGNPEQSVSIGGEGGAKLVYVESSGVGVVKGQEVSEFVFFKPDDLKQLDINAKNLVEEIGLDPKTINIRKFGDNKNEFVKNLKLSDSYTQGSYYEEGFDNANTLVSSISKRIETSVAKKEASNIANVNAKIEKNFEEGYVPAMVTYDGNPKQNLLKIEQWNLKEINRIGKITNLAEQTQAYNLHFAKFRQAYIMTHPANDFNGRMATIIVDAERWKVGLPPAVYDTANDVFLSPTKLGRQMGSNPDLVKEAKLH